MPRSYGYDVINGRRVPQTVIADDHEISGTHHGTVHVEGGCLTLSGTLQGTLAVQQGAEVLVKGNQKGTVSVEPGAEIVVTGAIHGTVAVERGGRVVVEQTGRLAGTLANNGLVIIRGVFGGASSGEGEIRLEGEGVVKAPVIRDGINVYEW